MNASETQKVDLVKEYLETKTQFAKDHNISPATLSRYLSKYHTDAEKRLKAEKNKARSGKAQPRRSKKGDVRNGRWAVLNRVFDKYGVEEKASVLMEKANKASVEAGLKPLAKPSFYAMLSIARKKRDVDIRKVAAQRKALQKTETKSRSRIH